MSESNSIVLEYGEALAELYKLEFFGMKLGLENIKNFLQELGNPQEKYPTVHVAGTNGKGSVSSMIASVFVESGKRTGLFTSPHLVDFRERIRIGTEYIPKDYVRTFFQQYWPLIKEINATFFETTTALAFNYFADAKVDIAVIETGLGGRLDSTNILSKPLATVVTSIGWDHMAQLGNTLELIASEKAGIFKKDSPAIVSVEPELRPVFEKRAREVGTAVFFAPMVSKTSITPPFPGDHQKRNLSTVLITFEHMTMPIESSIVQHGIERTRENIGLRARLEKYEHPLLEQSGITLLMDVGHNLNALQAVKEYFVERNERPILVMGLMKDKDITSVLGVIREFADSMIAVQAPTVRAMPSEELASVAKEQHLPIRDGGEVLAGLRVALTEAIEKQRASATKERTTILLCGSHYVVGEFLANESVVEDVYRSAAGPVVA